MKATLVLGLFVVAAACASEEVMRPAADVEPAIQASNTAAAYEMIDLGTLGGPSARAHSLNDDGQVVGWSYTASNTPHAFLWDGTIHDLAGGGEISFAHVVTADGVVLGGRQVLGGPGGEDCVQGFLFVWENGVNINLGGPGCAALIAIGMTKSGGIVGANNGEQNFTSSIWEGGVERRLGGLNPLWGYARARAVNDQGQIVGYSSTDQIAGHYIDRPFIWEGGVMRDLGILADVPCGDNPDKNCGKGDAFDINSKGEVAGSSNDHAVVWTREGIIDIGGAGGFNDSQASDINDHGEVVGYIGVNGFVWRKGALNFLASLGGATRAVGINERGVIAGQSVTPTGEQHVVVWEDGQIVDLGMGPGTGAEAVAINENGDVIGISGTCFTRPEGGCFGLGEPVRSILWRRLRPSQVAQQ